MDNILITFPRQTVAESYEAAKKFVESINLDVNDLHISEETWGIVVPSDTQAEFLEHAGNLGGKVFLLEEEHQPQFEEKTWIEVHEAVVGARFEMNGSQPVGKQEGRVLPGRYYVMGMQESDGSTFVTLARVDNVAELGKRTGPGRYVYAVDADTLGEAVNRPVRQALVKQGRDAQVAAAEDAYHAQGEQAGPALDLAMSKRSLSKARAAGDKKKVKAMADLVRGDAEHAHMDGSQGVQKVGESRQTRSDAILDMLLENDPGILAEKAKEEKAEQQRIALEEAAKAKEVVNENVEPSLEDLLRVSFNESARSEMARKAEKAGEEVAPAPVVEPQPEPEVAVEEPVEEPKSGLLGKLFGTNESVESPVVEESFSGADVLSGLLESVGETEGQHADETSPDNWMVDEFTPGEIVEESSEEEVVEEAKCDDDKKKDDKKKDDKDPEKQDVPEFIKDKMDDKDDKDDKKDESEEVVEEQDALEEGEMPSKDHVMKMCKKGMSMEDMLKMHKDADQDKLKAMIKGCMEEMKESEEGIEEGIDPAQFGAVRDVMAQLIEEGVDLESLSDEELAEAVNNKCDEILAEEEQPSEEPALTEGEDFEDEGFEVVAEADLSTESEEVVEEAMGEEEGEEEGAATLKDVLQKKAAEMADEEGEEEEGDEEESEEVAKEESFDDEPLDTNNRMARADALAAGRRQKRPGGGAKARKQYDDARGKRAQAYADARDAGTYPEDQDMPPLPGQEKKESSHDPEDRRIQGMVDPEMEAAASLHAQQDPRNKKKGKKAK